MSNQGPGPDPALQQFEVVGPPVHQRTRRSRYVAMLGVATLAAAAVGGGVWAWQSWIGQGAQPAEALPAGTLAYAALDLDPPGGQKVAAFQTLRKFPSLKKDLGLGSADDLSRSVVKQITAQGDCDIDVADLEPWLGDRVAFAVVQQDRPEPVLVLQVKDADKARAGLDAAGRGCAQADFGYVVDGDWAVLARNQAVAARTDRDAQHASLDQDRDFRTLTKAAGDPGLATLYAAPAAGRALLDEIDRNPYLGWTVTSGLEGALDPVSSLVMSLGTFAVADSTFTGGPVSSADEGSAGVSPKTRKAEARLEKRFEHFDQLSKREQRRLLRDQDELMKKTYGDGVPGAFEDPGTVDPGATDPGGDVPDGNLTGSFDSSGAITPPAINPTLRASLEDFSGLGGVARFAGGTLELEITGAVLEGTFGDAYAGSAGGDLVSKLPAGSAAAFGGGLADTWVDSLMTELAGGFAFSGGSKADATASFEKATGLVVPADLEALGGDGISLVAGSGFSPDRVLDDPAHLAVAVRIKGDADRIEAALDKLRTGLVPDAASKILSRPVDGGVVVGPDADYLGQLAAGGDDLGGSSRFKGVVPQADGATTALFVDFDAGDWLAKIAAPGDRKDAEPMDTLGMTVTKHGGQQRILLRMTFD